MKISVLLANYNHAKYISDAINGVLLQTYNNWEFIIVDDGSTDNSKEIIESFAIIENRIKAFFLEENIGALLAIKFAQEKCSGDFIISIASDDFISHNTFFERAINAFSKNNTGGFVGKTKLIDGINEQFITDVGYSFKINNISTWEFRYLFLNNLIFIPGSSSIWRKNYFDKLGGYDNGLGPQCDYLLNNLIGLKHGVYFEDIAFSTMRAFSNSYSQSQADVVFKNNFYKIFQILLKQDIIGKVYLSEVIKWFLVNGVKIKNTQMRSHLNFIFNKSKELSFDSVDFELIKQLKNTVNQEQFVKFQTSEIKEHTIKLLIECYFIFCRIFWKLKRIF